MTTTTVEMLDAYTHFTERVFTEREGDDERLIMLATMMDYIQRVGFDQDCLVYWPQYGVQMRPLSCLVKETICLEKESNMIQFAVNPHSYTTLHGGGRSCCRYCHFNLVSYRHDEFIPSGFVSSLFADLKRRRIKENTTLSSTRKRTFSEIHTINVTKKPPQQEKVTLLLSNSLPYQRQNNDFINGYTMTGVLDGRFVLRMSHIKGIIGVSPNPLSPLFTVIVSSSVLLRLESFSLDSPTRYIAITLFSESESTHTTTTIPYNALHHGFPLNSLVDGRDTVLCLVESNDALLFMFNDYAQDNIFEVQSPCKCTCNVEYTQYTLSYNDETIVPLGMKIEINPYLYAICRNRCDGYHTPAATASRIPKGKPGNRVNAEFDTYGSMETYFDVIDLIARIKIADAPDASVKIPEFYIFNNPLSVRQMRRSSAPSPLCFSGGGIVPSFSNGNSEIDPSLVWAIFYNFRALALFDVCGRNVSFKPIGPGECYEVVNYVVY